MSTTQPSKRMSLSQVLEMMLSRGGSERSTVTISRTPTGATAFEVKVRTGDEGDVMTVEDAEQRAAEVYDRLAARYEGRLAHDSSEVELTRNAKGETQVKVSTKASEAGPRTLEGVTEAALAAYERARLAYPMADGRTAAPGSVAEKGAADVAARGRAASSERAAESRSKGADDGGQE